MSVTPAQPKTADEITADVIREFERTTDPRLRQILVSLTKHLHAFVKDVELTEAEWFQSIQFLTATGHMCTGQRQEFILLSDTLGVSMVVDLLNHSREAGATESTVFGPFHRDGAPELPMGGNIAAADGGTPALITGRVVDTEGRPVPHAELDVWQADSTGLYDSQRTDLDHMHMRGRFKTDANGHYEIITTRPVAYSIPVDGPVGDMLRASHRSSWRPAHVHFVVSASGFDPVTTHIFDDIDKHLSADAVFAVKPSLCCTFRTAHEPKTLSNGQTLAAPYVHAHFDFVLSRKR